MVNQTPHCRFDLLRVDTNVQKRSSTCIKRTAGNGRMDDGLNCGRNVPGITRQTNALSFYSLGNEVDKERSRTASLIYKSIVIGITDKFSHPSSHICAVLSSSINPRRSTATPVVCLLAEPSKSQVRRTQAIGQRLVCENVPRMQARSAPHDWLTLTAIDTAHLCKSGQLHFISVSLKRLLFSFLLCYNDNCMRKVVSFFKIVGGSWLEYERKEAGRA